MSIYPSTLNFDATQVGADSPPQSVQVSNDTGSDVALTAIHFKGGAASDYMLVNNCPSTLPDQATCTIKVTVQPGDAGERDSRLQIASSLSDASQFIPVTTNATPASGPIETLLAADNFSGNQLSSHWTPSSGTWVQNNQLISPLAGTGWGTYLQFDKYYVTQLRSETVNFTFTLPGTVLGVGSARSSATPNPGITLSMFTVDSTNQSLNIMNTWTEGSAPTVLTSTPIPGGVILGRSYSLLIRVKNRKVVLILTDTVTGAQTTVSAGDNSSDQGYGYMSNEWGNFTDYPVFVAAAGQFTINKFRVVAETQYPRVMFIGDSITEGFGMLLENTWDQNIGQNAGPFIAAGRSGGGVAGSAAQMDSEVQFIQPQYLIVFIGTNDKTYNYSVAYYQSYIDTIIQKAAQYNTQLIFATIMPDVHIQASDYNAYLESLNIPIIRFDLAMTQNNDGVTYDPSLFQDGVHPTVNGNLIMMNRVLADTPQILR